MVLETSTAMPPSGVSAAAPSQESAILVTVRVRPLNSRELAMMPQEKQNKFSFMGQVFSQLNSSTVGVDSNSSSGCLRKVVHAIDDHVLVFDPPDDNEPVASARSGSSVLSNRTGLGSLGQSGRRHKDCRFVF